MIKGLIVTLPSDELRTKLEEVSETHRQKFALYGDRAAELEEDARLQDMSGSPFQTMKTRAEEHRGKMAYFQFLADHLIPNEDYQLSEGDLRSVEILTFFR